jgi:hypothetical protein
MCYLVRTISMEKWWNDIDRGNRRNQKNLFQCQFVNHTSTWTDTSANPDLRNEETATNRLSRDTTLGLRSTSLLATSVKRK